ncbi:MAG: YgaP-like transmembrane domain [Acidimicrobiales bacterium]
MEFVRFMSGPIGRGVRVVVGVVLVVLGIAAGNVGGWILALVGAVFVLTGALNICLLAPLFKGPLKGSDLS